MFAPMESKSIAVCFALKEEAAPFQKLCAGKTNVSIFLTGIGRANAEKTARGFLAANSPELLLTCGFAGGLNPDLKIGEVVFEISDFKIRNRLLAAGAKPAKFFCAGQIATTVAEKRKLRDETGADAAEMESGAVRAVCRERGISCATVRVISDAANDDLPLDFNRFLKADKSVDMGKLFLAVAKSPGKIGSLMELQKKTKFAAEQLAAVLEKIIFP
jgi:adenosylhomocysteine nucleosidase